MSDSDLKDGENHPLAHDALKYIQNYLISDMKKASMLKEALASTALSGNRIAEVCLGTLNRILDGQGVGERYAFGLAWFLKKHFDKEGKYDE